MKLQCEEMKIFYTLDKDEFLQKLYNFISLHIYLKQFLLLKQAVSDIIFC